MRFFISYRRTESYAYAWQMAEELKRRHGDGCVFLDIGDVQLGQDFRTRIEDEIRACDCVVVLIGPFWSDLTHADEDFVHLELSMARQHDRLIVPVLHTGASMPRRESLPPELEWLPYAQAGELRRPDEVALIVDEVVERTRRHRATTEHADVRPESVVGSDIGVAERMSADGAVRAPVVVIGCGGMAIREVHRLRKRFLGDGAAFGGSSPPWWKFLSMDLTASLEGDDVTVLDPADHLGFGQPATGHLALCRRLRSDGLSGLEGWLPEHIVDIPVGLGAGNRRDVGRVAVLAAESRVRAFVADAVDAMLRTARSQGVQSGVTVIVMASLTGGTGAGIWFDVCRIAAESSADVDVVLPVLMPLAGLDIFTDGGTANFFAAMSEMLNISSRGMAAVSSPILLPDDGTGCDEDDRVAAHEWIENLLLEPAAWTSTLRHLAGRAHEAGGRRGQGAASGAVALAVGVPPTRQAWAGADALAVAVERALDQIGGRSIRPAPESRGVHLVIESPTSMTEDFVDAIGHLGLVNPTVVFVPERRLGQVRVLAVAPPTRSVGHVRWLSEVFGPKWRLAASKRSASDPTSSRRACPMLDFIPVADDVLRAMGKGWIVGSLFGAVTGDVGSGGFAVSRLDDDRVPTVLPLPWPFLDGRNADAAGRWWMTGVLESFVVAELLQHAWPELRQSFDVLRDLGDRSGGVMAEWIDSATLPAESITTSPFLERVDQRALDDSQGRRDLLLRVLDARAEAYRPDENGRAHAAPAWLDADWLAWCSEIIDELVEAVRST